MRYSIEPAVITGVGVLACNGTGREAFWDALASGKSGIGEIDRFDPSDFPCRIAGQLWDFDANDYLSKADVKRWHRPVHQAMAAAQLALKDGELDTAGYEPERIAVGIGTSVGGLDESYEEYKRVFADKGWTGVDRMASSATSSHSATACVSAKYAFRGPAITLGSGCATGIDILTWAKRQVLSGQADAAVVGTTEAPLNRMLHAATCSLGILSAQNDHPDKAMRPFDKNSDGLVLSEAAAVLIVERADRAKARGARIYGELAGTGAAAEGRNPIVLERDGQALARAITNALGDAGMAPTEIDCIHAHGVALNMYDRCEAQAYKTALGSHAYRVPITASKSMIGQAYAVGGMLGVIGALLTLDRNVLPPTLNLHEPDPECDLDFVALNPRVNDLETALATALSFGGTHAAAVLRRSN